MGKQPNNMDVRFWRDPDLPGVEVRYSSYCEEAFRKHTHPAYSIGLIETGRTSFYLDGEMHETEAGQIALIPPDAVHACNPDLNSLWTYRMFYVDEELLIPIAEEIFDRSVDAVTFPSPVVEDPQLFDHWRNLHQIIIDGGSRLEKETLLVQGLADLISRHAAMGKAKETETDVAAVNAVKDHLKENLAAKVSLDDLSTIAHQSRYHLLRVFQATTGLPPHAYQNQLRVDLGKQLLAQGLPISQVATDAGFVDQSHFSRVFKQYTGATPKQYQAQTDA